MKARKERREITKAIRLSWESLETHLEAAVHIKKVEADFCGGRKFHAKAVRQYARIILCLSRKL